MRKLARRAAVVAGVAAAIAVGHNTNIYHGTDQWVGVTWGTVGGCEVGTLATNYGWLQTGSLADYVGCWKGISD